MRDKFVMEMRNKQQQQKEEEEQQQQQQIPTAPAGC